MSDNFLCILNCVMECQIAIKRALPNSVPRRKANLYLLLIAVTCVLLIFYSYLTFNKKNWTLITKEVVRDVSFYTNNKEVSDIKKVQIYKLGTKNIKTMNYPVLLQRLFGKRTSNTFVENRKRKVKNETEREKSMLKVISKYLPNQAIVKKYKSISITIPGTITSNFLDQFSKTSPLKSTEQKHIFRKVVTVNSEHPFTQSNEMSTIEMTDGENNVTKTIAVIEREMHGNLNDAIKSKHLVSDTKNETVIKTITSIKTTDAFETQNLQGAKMINFENGTTEVEKGYLVFSENCRIPDIDPWHPSILKYIEKSPPLDCSVNYEPLTRTDGNILILDEEAILERTAGEYYTCCYREVFRKFDGYTDNAVGYSGCNDLDRETIINHEFIHVKCRYENKTEFYQEFHSFISDKPRVEERCNSTDESLYSVLIIGVDSVSRMNMHRQLNATANYLLKEMEAIEMYGYNKVGDNTFPNLIPLLTGYDERELPLTCWKSQNLPLDNCNFLWKNFSRRGYRTFYAEDSPYISTFNYVKRGFLYQPTDYYFRPFIMAYEDTLGHDKLLNCYQCVGSISETEAVLNWAEQFALHFSNRSYFALSWINSLTHDLLNLGSAGDHMYERFFRNLHQAGALKKTIVILISDHGTRWGDMRNTNIGRLEERLPMLLISLPQIFKQKYPHFYKTLKENSHRLTTPYDLHATLRHLLNLTNNWTFENTDGVDEELSYSFGTRAQSLFQPVPAKRSCEDAFIEEHWCTCQVSVNVNVKNEKVKQVANFLLEYINKLLKPASDKCALLQLESILDARLWKASTEHTNHTINEDIYTVVIHTNPNKAVFEGTVKITRTKTTYKLLGTISRLNMYRNQSSCIDNAVLKKYCYCS